MCRSLHSSALNLVLISRLYVVAAACCLLLWPTSSLSRALDAPTAATQSAEHPTKLNIVFAFADDWGRYASAYRDIYPGGPSDIVATPNFDQIAQSGVLFTNAHVNAPSCTPCRSSLLSGQYFWRTGRGAILQGAIWDDSIPSYPLLLEQNAGYRIGHTYKVWSPGSPADQPHGGKRTAFNSAGRKFNAYSQQVSKADDKVAAQAELLDEVRANFASFLDTGEKDQPFCYWFGPTNCHRKWIAGSGKDIWGLDPDDLKGKLPKFLPDEPTIREDFCDYLGEVQAFDSALGVLLDELESRGLTDKTISVVSGDHGIPGIPRGKCNLYDLGTQVSLAIRWPGVTEQNQIVNDFVCLPDLAPTFLDAGGVPTPDVMTGRSLLPVLAAQKSGQVDPSRDHVIVGRERHVGDAREGSLPYPQRAIRTKDYLYIRNFEPTRFPMGDAPGFGRPAGDMGTTGELTNDTFVAFGDLDASPTKAWLLKNRDRAEVEAMVQLTLGLRPEEELYAVGQDPDHLSNLSSDPNYASVKKELSEKLMKTLLETDDPRVVEDPPRYERSPFTDAIRRNR